MFCLLQYVSTSLSTTLPISHKVVEPWLTKDSSGQISELIQAWAAHPESFQRHPPAGQLSPLNLCRTKKTTDFSGKVGFLT